MPSARRYVAWTTARSLPGRRPQRTTARERPRPGTVHAHPIRTTWVYLRLMSGRPTLPLPELGRTVGGSDDRPTTGSERSGGSGDRRRTVRRHGVRRLRTADVDVWYAQLRRSGRVGGRPSAPNSVGRIHGLLRRALTKASGGMADVRPGPPPPHGRPSTFGIEPSVGGSHAEHRATRTERQSLVSRATHAVVIAGLVVGLAACSSDDASAAMKDGDGRVW